MSGGKLIQFHLRIMKRRGYNRALVALLRKMLVAIYHILNRDSQYRSFRPGFFEKNLGELPLSNSA
jgi:uncharacterized protein YihD (DUF1040 family)